MANNKSSVWARRKARRALLQAVYQWQLTDHDFSDIRDDFASGEALKKADTEFFDELLGKVMRRTDELDDSFGALLDRPAEQLDQVERAILRLASAEFLFRIDVPFRVVIDEYVELAKSFGAQDSHKYINGVLDKLASSLRTIEVEAARGG